MNTVTRLIGAALLSASAIGATTGVALAYPDTTDLDAGNYSVDTISVSAPFGSLQVPIIGADWAEFGTYLASLSSAEATELNQRCAVVGTNPGTYGSVAANFCGNYFIAAGQYIDPTDDV